MDTGLPKTWSPTMLVRIRLRPPSFLMIASTPAAPTSDRSLGDRTDSRPGLFGRRASRLLPRGGLIRPTPLLGTAHELDVDLRSDTDLLLQLDRWPDHLEASSPVPGLMLSLAAGGVPSCRLGGWSRRRGAWPPPRLARANVTRVDYARNPWSDPRSRQVLLATSAGDGDSRPQVANALRRADTSFHSQRGIRLEFGKGRNRRCCLERTYGKAETGLQAPSGKTQIEFTYRLTTAR
jgi:hypothetical protein